MQTLEKHLPQLVQITVILCATVFAVFAIWFSENKQQTTEYIVFILFLLIFMANAKRS